MEHDDSRPMIGGHLIVASVLLLLVSITQALACDPSNRPERNRNNVWYCYRDSDTVIVFVHGVLSDSLTSWLNTEEEGETYWPKLVIEDDLMGHAAVFLGGYSTEVVQGNAYNIDDAAEELFASMNTAQAGKLPSRDSHRGLADPCSDSASLMDFDLLPSAHAADDQSGPIHFDGWAPHSNRFPYYGKGDMSYSFALDTLNMTGANRGYELLRVDFRFYDASGNTMAEAASQRPYVAYRHFNEADIAFAKGALNRNEGLDEDQGGRFQWRGHFVPGAAIDRFEIMLQSSRNAQRAVPIFEREIARLDNGPLYFEGQRVVGRLRPRRSDNPAVGMALALKDENSGRIESTFTKAEVKEVCRWVNDNLSRLRQLGVSVTQPYIYDFAPRGFDPTNDRGKVSGYCSNAG